MLGFVFATLAAPMAFLITYEEWSHHLLPRRVVVGHAVQAAVVTWIFFFTVAIGLGLLLSRIKL